MDDITNINPKKDSSLAMMLEAQKRGWQIYTFDACDMFSKQGEVFASASKTTVRDDLTTWFTKSTSEVVNLTQFDVILMRKDPPFDMNYIYATYLLELAETRGVLVANKPQSLRDFNEKLAIMNFPQCITNTLVSAEEKIIIDFLHQHHSIVIKPLDGMGGQDIFKLSAADLTQAHKHIKQLTRHGITQIMAQQFLPDITQGDKRILIINGKPIPYALNRVPAKGNWKGNLAQGATGIAQPLSKRDIWLCEQIAPTLINKGLFFVGLDVIGDYITEINVTSPTGIRELDAQCDLNIAGELFDTLEQHLPNT